MKRDTRNHSPEALHRARKLRREMSISKRVLWECLRKDRLGFRFKRQGSVGRYTLDFYCPGASLCVEVDGEQYALHRERDGARDEWLLLQGVATVRLPSLELFEKAGLVGPKWVRLIRETCEKRAGRKAFPA